MPDIRFLLKVSRPRFWIYIFGPYLIGLVAAVNYKQELLDWRVLVFGLFFTLPANLLIYGINDIFDYETDKLNPKKEGYEALVTPERRGGLIAAILVTNIPFFAVAVTLGVQPMIAFASFLFYSIFYSAPPIRAKAWPFLDSLFNVLYIMPGIFAFAMLTGDTAAKCRLHRRRTVDSGNARVFCDSRHRSRSRSKTFDNRDRPRLDRHASVLPRRIHRFGRTCLPISRQDRHVVIGLIYVGMMLVFIDRPKTRNQFSVFTDVFRSSMPVSASRYFGTSRSRNSTVHFHTCQTSP